LKASPFIESREDKDHQAFVLKGEWTIYNAAAIRKTLASRKKRRSLHEPVVEAGSLEKLDTAGAWLLKEYFPKAAIHNLTPRHKALLKFVPDTQDKKEPEKRISAVWNFFAAVGGTACSAWRLFYGVIAFAGRSFIRLLRNFAGPRHFRLTAITRHIQDTGVAALPIVGTLALGTSMVVAYQAATQLRKFGADVFTVDLTVISLLREMSVLITAIMVAGRSGSAFAAELGVMKLRGEVDALRTMGMDPVEMLVLPRVLALLITLPLLTFIADIVGIAGGGLMALDLLHLSPLQYIDRVHGIATPRMFFVGMIKAPVFALLIAMVCTYQGLNVSGSAESVGKATTLAVVQSIFLVIMADAVFSIVFSRMGL
jgi:phospholipid/cholesterol/gamma-HCH transport system permease protein